MQNAKCRVQSYRILPNAENTAVLSITQLPQVRAGRGFLGGGWLLGAAAPAGACRAQPPKAALSAELSLGRSRAIAFFDSLERAVPFWYGSWFVSAEYLPGIPGYLMTLTLRTPSTLFKWSTTAWEGCWSKSSMV